MSDFHYADQGDALTGDLISQNYDERYWARSEARLLEAARAYLSRCFGDSLKDRKMLDLGCGMGRLIPEFAAVCGHVTGLEPDLERCGEAADLIQSTGTENADVWNGNLEDYLEKAEGGPRFDIVLCSHIFQHISHSTVSGILRNLKQATGENAVFIFTTTFTEGSENEYTVEEFRDGVRVSGVTDEAGFEQAVKEGNRLPVCRFARPWMESLLAGHGLSVEDFCCYHFYGQSNEENDRLWTQDPEKRSLARDAYYLCRWKIPEKEITCETLASGKVAYMQYYYLPAGSCTLDTLPQEDRAQDCTGYRRKVLEDLETSRSFLYGAGLHFPARRYLPEFPDLYLKSHSVPILHSHVMLSVYPDASACQVTVCLELGETPVRDFIYLHQIQCSEGVKFIAGAESVSVPEICRRVLERYGLRGALGPDTAILTELNTLGDCDGTDNLTDSEARCVYGVLSGDEGWRYVPVSLAKSRLENGWGSRDFALVTAFSGNFALLNFNRGAAYRNYLEQQHGFADHYWGGLNPYFTMDAATAGVNHGVFFSVEAGMLVKTITDHFIDSRQEIRHRTGGYLRKEIKQNKHYRAEMIRTMNRLEKVNITELGELDTLVMRSLDTDNRMESIRDLLELLESDLDLMYQTSTNRMVNMLTVLGLILAVAQVLLAIWPLG